MKGPGEGIVSKVAAIAASFNFAYLMLAFLVPVYALHLGYSIVSIGLLASVPSILQVPLRGLGGVLTDSWDEQSLLRIAFAGGALSGLVLVIDPGDLTALVGSQLAVGVARGLYWVPMQSYVTRLPGDRARGIGLLASFNNAGALAGIVLAGPLAVAFGYRAAFGITAACQLASLCLTFALPRLPVSVAPPTFGAAVAELGRAMVRPLIWLCGGISVLSAIPQALVQSFYPVYLVHLGQGPAVASGITSMRSLGMIATGFIAAAVFRRLGERRSFELAGVAMALTLAATWWGANLVAVTLCILVGGVTSGLLSVLSTTMVANASSDAERGAYIAAINVFFATSMLLLPLLFGLVAARLGLADTFIVLGACCVFWVAVVAAAWRVAQRRPTPAAGAVQGVLD